MASDDEATAVEVNRPRGQRAPVSHALERGASIDRYLVLDVLGEGGMGVIYRAYDPSLDRQVALKCVRPRDRRGAGIPHARERLFREAQALAQLSHPNVVAVHDVGVSGDDVYIAMELVEGETLRSWLRQQRRSVEDILEVFAAAGAGLAAAHRQGLVHRDFKPDNVILGSDGRVRVIDFGLARGPRDSSPSLDDAIPTPIPDGWGEQETADTAISPMYAWAKALTHMGAIVGTPPYMAPEQHRGENVDALTDQFSYGVSLFEALYGQLPFKGATRKLLAEAIANGRIEEPAAPGVRISPQLRRIVRRALANERSERYPAMDQLLADLRRMSRSSHTRLAIAGVAGALLISGTVLGAARLSRSPDEEPCGGASARLAGVWDPQVRAQVEQAFKQTGYKFALDSFDRVAHVLDGYTASATAMQHESCVATRVRGEQSAELLDLRTACLERRWSELRALTHELTTTTSKSVVAGAADAASKLPALAPCADAVGLRKAYPAPTDPARAKVVTQVNSLIDQSRALYLTGELPKGAEVARQAVKLAQPLKYPPAQAEALYALGFNLRGSGAEEEAATWRELIKVAAQSRDEAMVAEGWTQLMLCLSESNPEETLRLKEQAETAITLAGDDPIIRCHMLTAIGLASNMLGKDKETRAAREAALAAAMQRQTEDNQETIAGAEINLGRFLDGLGETKVGRAHIEKGVALIMKVLGPHHPDVALAKFNLADTLMNHDRYAEAEPLLLAAGESWEATFGPDHRNLAFIHGDLALIASYRGEHAIAKQKAARAIEISEKVFGKDHVADADVYEVNGRVLGAAGEYQKAIEQFRRVLAIDRKQAEANSVTVGWVYNDMGDAASAAKKWPDARQYYTKALKILEPSLGPDAYPVATMYVGLADCDFEAKKYAQSAKEAERAYAILTKVDASPLVLAQAKFMVAKAHWELRTDRPGAIALAKEALEGYHTLGNLFELDRKEIETWLAARR